ncbi:hypothetical protein BN1708_008515 [Verticillium longisporum]|uniref:Uncharacterized protein n=1 Tax=Verticillium longisporum TaxID=100787 RepID=A0A0G4N549_VERLO|nr:hypothetical protein BN1708_008515 [Verticillium longisporum]
MATRIQTPNGHEYRDPSSGKHPDSPNGNPRQRTTTTSKKQNGRKNSKEEKSTASHFGLQEAEGTQRTYRKGNRYLGRLRILRLSWCLVPDDRVSLLMWYMWIGAACYNSNIPWPEANQSWTQFGQHLSHLMYTDAFPTLRAWRI